MCRSLLLVLSASSSTTFVIMDTEDWFWRLIPVTSVVSSYSLIVGCVWPYFANEVILWVRTWKNGASIGRSSRVWKKSSRSNSFLFFVILLYTEIFTYACWASFSRSIDLLLLINWNIFLSTCTHFWLMRSVFIRKLDVVKYDKN